MKKRIIYFLPFFFALFSFLFYIVVYKPPVKSGDFVTALLVFFAALGSSGIIIFLKEECHGIVYLYASAAVIFLLLTLLVCKESRDPWHMVLVGLIVLAFVYLKFFVSSHLKYEKRREK